MTTTNRKIVWEDFLTNYAPTKASFDDGEDPADALDIDDNDEFNDDDEDGPSTGGMSGMPFTILGFPGMGGEAGIQTPWGVFRKENKLAPFNFYELKIAHLRGFSSNSYSRFGEILNEIEGVAVWKLLDPYCIIVGKARLYEWPEIVCGFNSKFIGNTSSLPAAKDKKELAQEMILAYTADINDENYIGVRFPSGKITFYKSSTEPQFEEKVEEILKLRNTIEDIIIIHNGEILL